ncbi:ABC superfamily ATP binding cassette transporter, ABC protein [Limosilactobacillus frumenti DSM 13145]|uniref:ABC superfamily ATP binding cassette transporter, ABC protein n=1 Tax=Limosilactobacillus frumenti DSM 13145 TaxID=1423746 RepID=A0A0R1P843_9LACO|nr:methionine ABC transporter ATP-binding protein [Limosilactobacillus frumenti]KRL28630.1 ABC superfamily ATP binding cassette transporter, ABC protein [Limosilactobacillus frumenti DSM 13145]MBA2914153.1 methionine ABC transporter ATP-binding protein [Limosilactobacillus frumenti]QFG72303.1 methionine ABC transporter ATP-binding protein [Limosilactobacillus frumenti]
MIEFKDVSKTYQAKEGPVKAITDVNLTIPDGKIYGIVGYSGAGKSTLIRMLNGLETPTTGKVTVNGQNVSELSGQRLREERLQIGMIFQHFDLLWSRTVLENVEFPLEIAKKGNKKERQKKAEELVKLVGLQGRENAYPSELSGGQKQRVGIARALANDPKILLSDEATSALDPQTTDEVLELLLDINHRLGITIVVITHEMHVIRKICDHVAVLDAGRIVEEGPVLDVFKHPQQAITKRFVNQETSTGSAQDTKTVVQQLLASHPDGVIVKLTFHGDQAKLPIVSEMLRQFPEVDMSIIEGNIHQTTEGSIGSLYIQLEAEQGQQKQIQGALDYLNTMRVETEVINSEQQ